MVEHSLSLPQSHRAAHVSLIVFRHVDHDFVRRIDVRFDGTGVFEPEFVATVLDNSTLEPQTHAQKWDFADARLSDGSNLPIDAPFTEAAGYQDAPEPSSQNQ